MHYLIIIFIFLFGLIIGSFLNCLIWRLHQGEGILNRSYCPKCKKQIAWYDNIPILSFIVLRGKCRYCGKAISWQYPIVELVTGALFVMAVICNLIPRGIAGWDLSQIANFQLLITIIRDWFLIAVMIIIFIYDLRWYLILDIITLPACAIVFILNLIISFQCSQCAQWPNLLISGIIGGSFFLIQFIISRGKWIGGGDIRLGLLMGLALGWPKIIVAIFLAYLIGSVVGVGLLMAGKKKWGSKLPLGVFLSAATVVVLFWGERIVGWYMNLF
ncbi:prepilin peptidase [Candidatus Parcubacteria bacterium]|nr:prepilin peptidase [Candidatus Parcubacteria bacterium]